MKVITHAPIKKGDDDISVEEEVRTLCARGLTGYTRARQLIYFVRSAGKVRPAEIWCAWEERARSIMIPLRDISPGRGARAHKKGSRETDAYKCSLLTGSLFYIASPLCAPRLLVSRLCTLSIRFFKTFSQDNVLGHQLYNGCSKARGKLLQVSSGATFSTLTNLCSPTFCTSRAGRTGEAQYKK